MSHKKRLLRILNLLLTLALFVFAFIYIKELAIQTDFSKIEIKWYYLVLSIILFLVFYLILSFHWVVNSRLISGKANTAQFLAFFASQPYKYLPTSLFTFSARAIYAKKLGVNMKHSTLAQITENGSLIMSSFMLFLLAYLSSKNIMLGLSGIMGITVLLVFFNQRQNIKFSFQGKYLILDVKQMTNTFLIATMGWLLGGLSFMALAAATSMPFNFLNFIAVNCLAFTLSILAFFAPGGLGIREFVYNAFSISNVVIIVWRILTFMLDILFGYLAILTINLLQKDHIKT
jgi:uncharacterized membrane protein YbhN (UPF0104 family)